MGWAAVKGLCLHVCRVEEDRKAGTSQVRGLIPSSLGGGPGACRGQGQVCDRLCLFLAKSRAWRVAFFLAQWGLVMVKTG